MINSVFSCEEAALEVQMSVRPSVRPSSPKLKFSYLVLPFLQPLQFIFQVVYICVMFRPCTFLLYTCTVSIAVKPVLTICVHLYSNLQ